ncbi:wall-associated receptor kinase-like 8 [Syzygium oleosum]|uniref:wall-associated receptor kinase-like 8 n=1 Tax=Syzygium oleosum TaxID=219896 RepID=UPI0024BBA07E|nr:wall-associated receptor kinase-like 8 [Syzygium oleosum]
MVVPWLFHSILLLAFLLHKAAAQTTASLAKPGCSQYCGNVVIPFPFGIGENCYLDKWFEIKCEFERPSLASVGLDVLQITLATYEEKPGIIRVQSPIIYSNCSGVGSTNASVSLEGSPFVFSQTKNRFGAVGCNTRALLRGAESTVTGCESVCEGGRTKTNFSSCSGKNCCQDKIPVDLKIFNVSIGSIGPGKDEEGSKYAFLVEREWLVSNMTDPLTSPYMENVPVVLDWGLNKVSLDALGQRNDRADFTSYYCGLTSDLSYLKYENSTTQCACYYGYNGNPYLADGCKDISMSLYVTSTPSSHDLLDINESGYPAHCQEHVRTFVGATHADFKEAFRPGSSL